LDVSAGRELCQVSLGLELHENFARLSFPELTDLGDIHGESALAERFRFRGVCLENRYTRKGIVGSNPTLSVSPAYHHSASASHTATAMRKRLSILRHGAYSL
jgi:hypothetical protein